jgi:hypothetical protein
VVLSNAILMLLAEFPLAAATSITRRFGGLMRGAHTAARPHAGPT